MLTRHRASVMETVRQLEDLGSEWWRRRTRSANRELLMMIGKINNIDCCLSFLRQRYENLAKQMRPMRVRGKRVRMTYILNPSFEAGALRVLRSESKSVWRKLLACDTLSSIQKYLDTVEEQIGSMQRVEAYFSDVSNISSVLSERPDQECMVCMEDVPCARLVPCGHKGVCAACTVRVYRDSNKCPLCRVQFNDAV